jgi:hypothetical protein
MDLLTSRAHASSHFHFAIDGQESFLVKSFEGGLPKGNTVEEPIGTTLHVIKHLTTFEIEPLTVELGMQDGLPMLKWIRDSWTTNYCRKNGSVKLADFNLKNVKEYQFSNALITETTFPTLDASAKEGAMLKVKIQPEDALLSAGDSNQIVAQMKAFQKQKLWITSNFELDLKGYDTRGISKIDGFTVKQGVKSYSTGRNRYPFWEPTKLVFPDISVYMAMAHAESMLGWYQKTCEDRNTDPKLQTTGSIFYLDPTLSRHVFEIKLTGVGLKGMTIDKAERGDSPRRIKFDLYVSEMDIATSGVLAY